MIDQVRPVALAAWFTAQREAFGDKEASAAAVVLPVLLDVREPWELAQASVQAHGFQLVAWPMGSVPARIQQLNPEHPIACLCHHGVRSQRVAMYLAQNGFDRVANVVGGIEAWSSELDASVPRY